MSKVVAKVNSQEITEEDLNEMVNAYQMQTKKPEITDGDRKMLLENLIENKLLQEESQARDLTVTDDFLNQQLNFFYQQYGGEEKLKKMLTMQNIKIEDIIENMKLDLQGQLTAKDEIGKKLNITDTDLTKFYDANKDSIKTEESLRASHILFNAEDENAKEKADKVLEEIKNDKDFAELAKEHSSCPSKDNGGDLNFFARGQMVPEFENAVLNMKIDEVSEPVKTQFGYHIIKKTAHTEGKQLTFDEAKSQIKEMLTRDKGQVIVKELIENLREKFDIEYTA